MELSYRKRNNSGLFQALGDAEQGLDLSQVQNYVPMYTRFFDLTPGNSMHLNLNHRYHLAEIVKKTGPTTFDVLLEDDDGNRKATSVFFKLAPLLDPLRCLTGKYGDMATTQATLPRVGELAGHPKTRDLNNAAYVDAFFTFLTSKLLHDHGFAHGLDYYGSCLGIKSGFNLDVSEDLDLLSGSAYFVAEEGRLFDFVETDGTGRRLARGSGGHQVKVLISSEPNVDAPISSPTELRELNEIFAEAPSELTEEAPELVYSLGAGGTPGSLGGARSATARSSLCSSRTSGTSGSASAGGDSISEGCDQSDDEYSTATEDMVTISIKSFPVHAVALERCEKTLDALAMGGSMSNQEWESAMFQVLATLWAYQRCFGLTHNDLHANNIMYTHTDRKYLNYKWHGRHYRLPTFGRVYKIIDYGRAIYRYRGELMCSDSFHPKGDAASQYNCPPYLNSDKPRLDPNPSFDLCRLGCSLYDFLLEELRGDERRASPVQKMIISWCTDDKERNVMYKSSGEERYPEFKLYKMIARTVHKHPPTAGLENVCFGKYIVARKTMSRKAKIMNLESLPDLREPLVQELQRCPAA
jgi:hypothetical protein